jgi:hypothetical protein
MNPFEPIVSKYTFVFLYKFHVYIWGFISWSPTHVIWISNEEYIPWG